MTDLADLIARVEGATEGSRELDEVLTAWAVGATRQEDATFDHKPAYHRDGSWVSIEPVTPLTTSMDAAVALIDQKMPGTFWHVAKGRMTATEPLFGAALFFGADEELGHGESFNAATSLVLALLRSLQAGAQN